MSGGVTALGRLVGRLDTLGVACRRCLRRSTAVPGAAAETAPTRRDRHLRLIAEKGRMGWQKATGYNERARAEAAISRYKRVIGDGLRSGTDRRRATEVNVGVHVLNRMLDLGRPNHVRIA